MELKRSSPYSFRRESGHKETQKRPVNIGPTMIRMQMKVRESNALMTQQSTDTGQESAGGKAGKARSQDPRKRRGSGQ